METNIDLFEELLVSLRQIMRATDLESKKLMKITGLTAPQTHVLKAIRKLPPYSLKELSDRLSLSSATVSSILDRLYAKGFVERKRSGTDKRKLLIKITEMGCEAMDKAPARLQEVFSKRFFKIQGWEQHLLLASTQRIVSMLNAEDIGASPILTSGEIKS